MYEFIRKDNRILVPFEWTDQKQKVFDEIKKKMTTALIIVHPDFDKPFILYTDASERDVRAVQHQKGDDEKEKLIVCISRAFNKHEKKYLIIKQECFAIVWGVEKFKQHLEVKPFTIITDYMTLEMVKTANLPIGRKARWLCKL